VKAIILSALGGLADDSAGGKQYERDRDEHADQPSAQPLRVMVVGQASPLGSASYERRPVGGRRVHKPAIRDGGTSIFWATFGDARSVL
jgi:hypothetical protein